MPNAKDKQKQRFLCHWLSFLSQEDVQHNIFQLTPSDILEAGPIITALQEKAAEIWHEDIDIEKLSNHINRIWQMADCPEAIRDVLDHYRLCQRLSHVSHQEKRSIAYALGLFTKPFCISDLLSSDVAHTHPFILQERERSEHCPVERLRTISEVADGDAFVVDVASGFEIVDVDTSVIYYSTDCDGQIIVELVILRGVGCNTPFTKDLFDWIYAVILTACNERRNVRPNDVGTIIQLGLNMGPQNAHVLGLAKSFTKKIDQATKVEHDQDAVGVISLAWGLMEKLMPQEVINETNQHLRDLGLPELTTQNLPSGSGYTIQIGDIPLTFPAAKRAPPEGYLSKGYEARAHIDKTYSPYAFSLNVDRRFTEKPPSTSPYITRGLSNKPEPIIGPPGGGASFVDFTVKVVVRQAPGTMMATQPKYMHATTKGYGVENSGITITFSDRIKKPWLAATRGELGFSVESFKHEY